MKVVHIVTLLELGGAQQNTLHTVRHLDRARFAPVLIAGRGGLLDEEARKIPDLSLYFLDELVRPIRPLKDFAAFWKILRILKAERPAVVHTHSSKAGILGRLAARVAGVPVLLHTFHGFGFHDGQRAWVRGCLAFAERLAAKLSTRLIFVSKANQEYAARRRLGSPDRHILIRSGIPLSDYPAKAVDPMKRKAELGVGMHKPLVVTVANLKPQKNPEDFLSLAKMVHDRNPEARFLYVGDGPLRGRMEARLVSLGLHGKCVLAGWRRDVPEILAAADVFVLTSLWEGLPRSLVEAMKTGLPCACYDIDGVQDIVKEGETGYLVRPGDVGALAEKVAYLLEHAESRREMGRKASQAIGPEFDIDRMVRRQEELYEELTRNHEREKV